MTLKRPSVAVFALQGLLKQYERTGVDLNALLRMAGVDEATISDQEARIPIASMVTLIERFMTNSGDEAFALHSAENLPLGEFGAVEFAAANAATVADALKQLCRYFHLLTDMCRLTYAELGALAEFKLDMAVDNALAERFAVEFTFGRTVFQGRHYVDGFKVHALHVRYPMPAYADELHRVFDADILYERPFNALFLDLAIARKPWASANPRLFEILEKVCDDKLACLPAVDSLSVTVCNILMQAYSRGIETSMAVAAKQLGMGGRTLQRRLAAEGTGFKEIREQVRRDFACMCLRQPILAIAEIAHLLGFSEPSAFHRAFKRWMGQTPHSFRET